MSYMKDATTMYDQRTQQAWDTLRSEMEWRGSVIEDLEAEIERTKASRDQWRKMAMEATEELYRVCQRNHDNVEAAIRRAKECENE